MARAAEPAEIYGARIELGLRHLLDAGRIDAVTTNVEDPGGLRHLPGLAVQNLMAGRRSWTSPTSRAWNSS